MALYLPKPTMLIDNPKIMKIAVFTLPYELANEAKKINDLFDAGLETLHLRKPCLKKNEFITLLEGIKSEHHPKIVIHDFIDLALKYELKGIHVSPNFFNGLIGKFRKRKFRSLSKQQFATTIVDVSKIEEVHPLFQTVFIGPMFLKYSEANIKVNFDAFQVKKAIQSSNKEIFALGGIDIKNQERCAGLGFEGLALQSAIWKSDDILNAFRAFQLAQETPQAPAADIKTA